MASTKLSFVKIFGNVVKIIILGPKHSGRRPFGNVHNTILVKKNNNNWYRITDVKCVTLLINFLLLLLIIMYYLNSHQFSLSPVFHYIIQTGGSYESLRKHEYRFVSLTFSKSHPEYNNGPSENLSYLSHDGSAVKNSFSLSFRSRTV